MGTRAAFGMFKSRSEISDAIQFLNKEGVKSSDISVLFPEQPVPEDIPYRQKTQIVTGAVIGAAAGVTIATTLALIVGVNLMDALNMPNHLSSMYAVRLIGLVALIFGGGIIGASVGTLIGIGTPKPAGQRYGEYAKDGGILLSVHVHDNAEDHKVKEILDSTGGQDITSMPEAEAWEKIVDEEQKPNPTERAT